VTYHPLGAGPGPVEEYSVDMPFPWGDNTKIRVPVYAMVNDSLRAMNQTVIASKIPWDSILRRMEVSIPMWVDQAAENMQPHVDAWIDKATNRVALAGGVMVLGMAATAWYVRRKK